LIILSSVGGSDPTFHFPKDRIIQFRREPDFIQQFKPMDDIKRVFDYTNDGFHVSTWQFIRLSFDDVMNQQYISKKEKCSTVCSPKWNHRNIFLRKLAKSTPYQIDMYGPHNTKQIFGDLHKNIDRKYKDEALLPYEYSIAMENSSQNNYFTEKINDCFLSWTMPIYWGCPNIQNYFPEDSYKLLDIHDPSCIKEIIEQPIEKKQIEAMRESRDLIINKYNIWPTIKRII